MRSLVLYAASGCNLRCKHCAVGSDQASPRPSLSTADVSAILRNAAANHVKLITLLGGEIFFVRDDLEEIFGCADSLGLSLSVNTNLLFPEHLIALKEHPSLSNVSFSLDGSSADAHDKIRGRGMFEKTISAYHKIKREMSGREDISFDINYTFNALNKDEPYGIVALSNELAVRRLNVTLLALKDFAVRNSRLLALDDRGLIDGISALLLAWTGSGRTQISIYIPPLFAAYLQARFGTTFVAPNYQGCGGPDVYGYVDNDGNHLPCPSMSYDHNRRVDKGSRLNLDARIRSLEDIWKESPFRLFESSRHQGSFMRETYSCPQCVFRESCRPCTSSVIEGGPQEQPLCAALARVGNEYVPEFTATHLSAAP